MAERLCGNCTGFHAIPEISAGPVTVGTCLKIACLVTSAERLRGFCNHHEYVQETAK